MLEITLRIAGLIALGPVAGHVTVRHNPAIHKPINAAVTLGGPASVSRGLQPCVHLVLPAAASFSFYSSKLMSSWVLMSAWFCKEIVILTFWNSFHFNR